MNFLIKDKTFYIKLFSIAIPIALQNLITIGISMMDTVMLGRLGEVQMTGATLANQVFFIFNSFVFGLCSGSNVMISQYWGKKDVVQIKKIMSWMYKIVIVLSMIFGTIALFMPRMVMSIFTTDQQVIIEGISYLKIIAFAYIFHGLTVSTVFTLRALSSVKIAVLVSGISLVTNTFLNWVMIFGKFGFPAMGVAGAALATVISRMVEFIIIYTYFRKYEKEIKFTVKDLLHMDKLMLPNYIKNVSPVMFNEILWGTGASTITLIISRMGTQFVAASSICSVVTQFMSAGIIGLANATAVTTGHTIGAGEYDKARNQSKTILALSVAMGLFACVAMLVTRPIIIDYYKISEITKGYAYDIMGVASFIVIFQSISIISMMGVLRGGGDSKFVFFADIFFMWVVAIPIGYLCGHVWGLPVALVYLVLKSDEILKSAFCSKRVWGGRWVRDLTM